MTDYDFDALVVGAGIHGAGVAQALAAAGQRVLVLERHEVASATSSRSSKLIHGGLRYLESRQFSLVRESLRERAILLRIAPRLVRMVPFHIPVYDSTSRGPWTMRAGLSLYAALANFRTHSGFRSLPRSTWGELDGLRTEGLRKVFRYYDGQTDDAVLTRSVLRSAQELGATLVTDADLLRGERDGATWNVTWFADGTEHAARVRVIVNTAGPWANELAGRLTPTPPTVAIDWVAGTHIELPGTQERGVYYCEAPRDRRAVFTIPWRGHTLVGTTEEPKREPEANPKPTADETDYLLETFAHHFPGRETTVLESWTGLRVLPRGTGAAFNRPRETQFITDDKARPTVIAIYGGKLTGYRHTAERVAHMLAPTLPKRESKARTDHLALELDPEDAERMAWFDPAEFSAGATGA